MSTTDRTALTSPGRCPAGTPCDCRHCAPELHDDPDAFLAAGVERAEGRVAKLERELEATSLSLADARAVLALVVGVMGRVSTRLAAAVDGVQQGEPVDVTDLMALRTLLEAASLRAALAAGAEGGAG